MLKMASAVALHCEQKETTIVAEFTYLNVQVSNKYMNNHISVERTTILYKSNMNLEQENNYLVIIIIYS